MEAQSSEDTYSTSATLETVATEVSEDAANAPVQPRHAPKYTFTAAAHEAGSHAEAYTPEAPDTATPDQDAGSSAPTSSAEANAK